MGFIFSGVFWGVFLILVGAVMVLNIVLGIKIPVFRILFALFLIFWGISLLTGMNFRHRGRNAAVFEDRDITADGTHNQYSVVFGQSNIDLTGIRPAGAVRRVEISTVFGNSTVTLDPSVPCKVRVTSAFAAARLPDGNVISFGEYAFKTDSLTEDTTAYLQVDASTVFGETRFVLKR